MLVKNIITFFMLSFGFSKLELLGEVKNEMKGKKLNTSQIFLFLILLGSVFIMLSCFHPYMWFDESYTIALIQHPFKEIWTIGSHDVHPILYYFLAHIIFKVTKSIICVRLFSSVPIIIMSILGYTHIRKDFGNKVGLMFSFLTLFFPSLLTYSGELRMYTWAMLFVTIMSIYAYRLYEENNAGTNNKTLNQVASDNEIKNWIIFSIFSLFSAYTHYYALIIAAIVNILLLIVFVKRKEKVNIKRELISAVIQVVLYLPWIGILSKQVKTVSRGYWIGKPNFVNIIKFIFTGALSSFSYIPDKIAIPFSFAMLIFLIYLLCKNWKKKGIKPVKLVVLIWSLLLILIRLISLVMGESIFYERYLFTLIGLLVFQLSFLASRENKKVIAIFCLCILAFSTFINANMININYDKSNKEPIEYLKQNIQVSDYIVVWNKNGTNSGFSSIAYILSKCYCQHNNIYYYNIQNWSTDGAYEAYGKTIYELNDLNNIYGRIWILSSEGLENDFVSKYNDAKIVEQKSFKTKYHDYEYQFTLIERKKNT